MKWQDLYPSEQFLTPEASIRFYLCDASQNNFNIMGTKSATLLHPARQDRFSSGAVQKVLRKTQAWLELRKRACPRLSITTKLVLLQRTDQVSGLIHQIET